MFGESEYRKQKAFGVVELSNACAIPCSNAEVSMVITSASKGSHWINDLVETRYGHMCVWIWVPGLAISAACNLKKHPPRLISKYFRFLAWSRFFQRQTFRSRLINLIMPMPASCKSDTSSRNANANWLVISLREIYLHVKMSNIR